MIKCMLYPADATLYEQARNYVAVIVAMRQRVAVAWTSSLNATRQRCHAAFETSLVHHGIEFYDKQDVLDIAVELSDYAERSSF